MWLFAQATSFTHSLWILLLQIPLFEAHLSRKSSATDNNLNSRPRCRDNSPPTDKTPTITELCLATLIFWSIQFIADTTTTITISLFIHTSHIAIWDLIGLIQPAIWESLWSPLITTWILYLGLHTILEFIFPALCAIHICPASTLQYTLSRARNLGAFLISSLPAPIIRSTLQQPNKRQIYIHQRTRSQSLPIVTPNTDRPNNIRLERTHSYPSARKGSRTLNWNLVVDALAMDEMKQTLGPPGGFGELGFCVQKEGVKFECMGPGTSFSLTFRLEGDERGRIGGEDSVASTSGKTRKKKQ